ncbi:MAG: 50S ribosomal protein L2 [Candidatus Pacearchaeota archaeon]|nr:50S ribosomal protein L2 [Candidatus Pacearchaeota archaeon]
MGKRIIQQARGHGSPVYRTRKKAFRISVSYPPLKEEGSAKVVKLLNSTAYTAPIAKISFNGKIFYNIAAEGLTEGEEIMIGKNAPIKAGNITYLENLPIGTEVFNIETFPGSGGKLVRSSGTCAKVIRKGEIITLLMPSKKEKEFHPNARATIGKVAGSGRIEKPFVKAGKKFYKMKARGGKVWPRTSAVKMNAVDHPFGSGRGKRIKSKIAKRHAPPGAKVGHIRPRRTGRKK